jgi:hypothetical protein
VNSEPRLTGDMEDLSTVSTSHRDPSSAKPASTFERMEEYKVVLEEHGRLSARRQNLNVFVAINTIFLTAIGFVLFQSKLDSWWFVGAVTAIALAITPINLTWRTAIDRYKNEIRVHIEYLSAIEREFRHRREASESGLREGELPIGFYLYNSVKRRPHGGKARIEKRLATYFITLYPVISIVTATLTYLVTNKLIPTAGL